MTAGAPVPAEAAPYAWEATQSPLSEDVQRLWAEVANGIDKSQTVVWKSAVESLEAANQFLTSSESARFFVEKYMQPIISILVEQYPAKIGIHERNCVQDSLNVAVIIISRDLDIQLRRNGECKLLEVLSLVFNKKKAYYKGNKGNWNNHVSGLPDVRLKMIDTFRQKEGFARLGTYLVERIGTPIFPSFDVLHQVLTALADVIPVRPVNPEQAGAVKEAETAAIEVAKATMKFVSSCSDDALKKIPPEHLNTVQHDLQRIFDKLVTTRRVNTYEFYAFWRSLILKLIKSPSLPLRLFGWQQLDDLLDACVEHRPPPRYFDVSSAGCSFVNGRYSFTGSVTSDGYSVRGADISYERRIPDGEPDGGGKKLTLFRCTMRSQQKWWFLSEADEEQPGTDRDIDYYQHKSKEHEETEPPPFGWLTCRNTGLDPPPRLKSVGVMVPPGEEFNTLEHQLAQWAIENDIIELVLGDSVHREIVSRSTALIKFLASMCERDSGVESTGTKSPNKYCLQFSHLLLAWKTCSRKTDSAVSAQIYQLLVSILPSCPSNLAIPLLKTVQASVYAGKDRSECLNEVADFCAALAAANSSDAKSASTINLADDVRAEVLEVLWSVLTHPDAASLKVHDVLKRYVTNELRVEPKGKDHRERYLGSCVKTLSDNSRSQFAGSVDEHQALRIVKLTHFVLEACPRVQAAKLVTHNHGSLPLLLFEELISFLKRRQPGTKGPLTIRKLPSLDMDSKQEINALPERLRILRYVYGVSDEILMSSSQLQGIWQLCSTSQDREEVMIFIASASSSGQTSSPRVGPALEHGPQQAMSVLPEDMLSAAFNDEVCTSAFLNLFCSASITFQSLGEGAYRSFQFLYNKLRLSPSSGQAATSAAIDTLWRICLGSSNDAVASQAMKDLLAVYIAHGGENGWVGAPGSDSMETEPSDDSFGRRVFDCLAAVKRGLDKKESSAILAADRCLQILNAAIGQTGLTSSITASTLSRLSSLPANTTLRDVVACLPHSMRGQACYRRISIMAKRTQNVQAAQSQVSGDRDKSPSTLRFSLDVHPLETLLSVKWKVAAHCDCPISTVKPISISGRVSGGGPRSNGAEAAPFTLNAVPDDSVMDELAIVQGCEIVFLVSERPAQQGPLPNNSKTARGTRSRDLSDIFCDDGQEFAGKLFEMLLRVLESLPFSESDEMNDDACVSADTHKLVWDLLLAMPTNSEVARRVTATAHSDFDAMEIDAKPSESWSRLLDLKSFHRSVYVLLAIDAFLEPAVEVLSSLPPEQKVLFESQTIENAFSFREGFIQSGGFNAVVRFFSSMEGYPGMNQSMARMGNAVALRILKCCLFGNGNLIRLQKGVATTSLDEAGARVMQSLSDAKGLLKNLAAMVVKDSGISTSTISDILKLLRFLFASSKTAHDFISLPGGMAEAFLVSLLLWEESSEGPRAISSAASKVRKTTHDLILTTSVLAEHALPWLIAAIEKIQLSSESTAEFFDVVQNLVSAEASNLSRKKSSTEELNRLATMVCKKLASCPRLNSESAQIDCPTGVLCGCLNLLRAIIETAGGSVLGKGTSKLIDELKVQRWSEALESPSKGMLSIVSQFRTKDKPEDSVLIDLMGVIFDVFLSPGDSTSDVAICCDKDSRQRGFDVVEASTRACVGPDGYIALVSRINGLMASAAPFLKHRWGQGTSGTEGHSRHGRNVSKYSGLRNQGCTCYMNSFLQQMFMMPELRKSICSAPLPALIRSSGGAVSSKGDELVGKKIALQWENGVSYDAIVESFDVSTGMHTIRYCPMTVATISGANHPQVHPEDIAMLPQSLPEEFLLSEGRPGKETGVFEVVGDSNPHQGAAISGSKVRHGDVEESEEEAASRHLMEEVQRTFIHLDEGSRGRCFDPRALVEASACLKLEFDVWQQNDASEFATKLLDRLETTLRRWAPDHFRYLDHTFGLKQAKQKICKECGLKTNREEKLLNVDCQIRGKSDILEALGSMTEVEIMEGDNQVFCDRCKKNTDTVLRTAISTLPNMLILSLKRFDLDYNTFETVKLNSRCAFGQTLNMKQYTLEGLETMEKTTEKGMMEGSPDDMDTRTEDSGTSLLPDEDYEYKLAGVLVHAGVAQGGHYYSFIKDRSPGSEEKWYRFDDEDVTPFDPSLIEVECFGGKVKKETKWPNGQVHTVESEQYANALMLFYEKLKPTDIPPPKEEEKKDQQKVVIPKDLVMTTGYDVFEPDVKLSNVTHQWQTFLFDSEFQAFLKGLLSSCRTPNAFDAREPGVHETRESVWKRAVVQMLLTFVFDVLLYSNDRYGLHDWVSMFEEIMDGDKVCAQIFLAAVASKTKQVSGNWLRTYLADCPDQVARSAAVRIFSAGFRACLALDNERTKLEKWTRAWMEQLAAISPTQQPLPCTLSGKWRNLERVDSAESSSMGSILSFVNVLIDVSPRNWRYSPELNAFIRNLASIDPAGGGNIVRQAMIESLIPARLICSVIRERAPRILRLAFPGSSVSVEVAETQIRPESNASTPMMAMGGNHPMNPADGNYRGCSLPLEFLSLFEALGCFLGIRGIVHSPLVVEVDEGRGRPRVSLSDNAVRALRELFVESCAQGAPGMGKREIELYLQKCGIDSVNLPTQKIEEIMAKYPTTGGNYLSLDGFLAYYQDTVQTNEMRVRLDLHTHGFRPDLSRRPVEARILSIQGRTGTRTLTSIESVARDVSTQPVPSLGKLADMGLDCFALYTTAYSASEAVAEYILSAAVLGRKTDTLLIETLKTIYTAPTGWVGNEILNAAIMVLRCMASVPDSRQRDRINLIMQCNEPPAPTVEYGIGLLVASKAFHSVRHSHNYPNDVSYAYDRYVGILKELLALREVYAWINDNRALWTWMERDLLGPHQPPSNHGQVRVDYNVRIEGEIPGVPLDDHGHSDSEGMPDIHGSEDEDDEESRYEDMETLGRGPSKIHVEGAGNPAVNGIYFRDGVFEDASKFSRNGEYGGKACNFSVFQCNVSNNTKHWYISIVPAGVNPGTRDDTDFYSAPVTETCTAFPPLSGWTKSNEGHDPPPTLSFKEDQENGQLVGPSWDENQNGRNTYV